jgi:hypothetical protein
MSLAPDQAGAPLSRLALQARIVEVNGAGESEEALGNRHKRCRNRDRMQDQLRAPGRSPARRRNSNCVPAINAAKPLRRGVDPAALSHESSLRKVALEQSE